jgi:hypothetical protein
MARPLHCASAQMTTGLRGTPDVWSDRFRPSRSRSWAGPTLLFGMMLLAAPGRAAAQATAPSMEDLIGKAERQGTMRVIVELKMDLSGPPTRESIAAAQDLVIQELAGTNHRVLRRFTTIPFLGLEVSADALRRLPGSAHVAGIREDMVLRPQGAPAKP